MKTISDKILCFLGIHTFVCDKKGKKKYWYGDVVYSHKCTKCGKITNGNLEIL